MSPVPLATVAPPTPSSTTTNLSSPLHDRGFHADVRRGCVLDGVRDRFADDEVGGRLDLGGKPLVGRFQVDRDGCGAGEVGEGRGQPLVQPRRPHACRDRAQVFDRPPDFAYR